jgi:hypothetical protein
MPKVLIVAGDGSGPEAEYGLFRMREDGIGCHDRRACQEETRTERQSRMTAADA